METTEILLTTAWPPDVPALAARLQEVCRVVGERTGSLPPTPEAVARFLADALRVAPRRGTAPDPDRRLRGGERGRVVTFALDWARRGKEYRLRAEVFSVWGVPGELPMARADRRGWVRCYPERVARLLHRWATRTRRQLLAMGLPPPVTPSGWHPGPILWRSRPARVAVLALLDEEGNHTGNLLVQTPLGGFPVWWPWGRADLPTALARALGLPKTTAAHLVAGDLCWEDLAPEVIATRLARAAEGEETWKR
jgi:hypothetical protein